MKKTIITLSVFFSLSAGLVSCSKSEDSKTNNTTNPPANTTVEYVQVNKELSMDITGTWCPPCGSYGIPGFNRAVKISNNNMIPLSVHSGDALSCATGNELMAYAPFKSSSVPRITMGNGLLFPAGVYSDTNATAGKIISALVDSAAGDVIIGTTISNLKTAEGKLTFDVNSKFFTDATGDYYMAAYIIEDGIVEPQKKSDGTTNNNQIHDHVLRGTANSTFGESWATGTTKAATINKKSYSVTIPATWKAANLHVAAVVWSKVGTKYYFVNGNTTYK
jgi:hypothetical protein